MAELRMGRKLRFKLLSTDVRLEGVCRSLTASVDFGSPCSDTGWPGQWFHALQYSITVESVYEFRIELPGSWSIRASFLSSPSSHGQDTSSEAYIGIDATECSNGKSTCGIITVAILRLQSFRQIVHAACHWEILYIVQ